MQVRKNKTAAQLLQKSIHSELGFVDGYDAVDKTLDGNKVSYNKEKPQASNYDDDGDRLGENAAHKALRQYRNSWFNTLIAIPFGHLMAKRRDTNNMALTIFFNALNKPEADAPRWKKGLMIAAMVIGFLPIPVPLLPLWIVARIVSRVAFKAVGFVALVLPKFAANGFKELYNRAKALDESNPLRLVAMIAAAIPFAIFYGINYITSTILDPVNAARKSLKQGGVWGPVLAGIRIVVGIVTFAFVVSFAQAAIMQYAAPFFNSVIAPALAKFGVMISNIPVVGTYVNFLTTYVWAPLGNLIVTGYDKVAGLISQGLSAIYTNVIAPSQFLSLATMIFNYGVSSLAQTVGLVVQPLMIGLGAAAASVAMTVGSIAERIYSAIRNKIVGAEVVRAPVPVIAAPGTKAELRNDVDGLDNALRQTNADVANKADTAAVNFALAGKANAADLAAKADAAALATKADDAVVKTVSGKVAELNEASVAQGNAIRTVHERIGKVVNHLNDNIATKNEVAALREDVKALAQQFGLQAPAAQQAQQQQQQAQQAAADAANAAANQNQGQAPGMNNGNGGQNNA